MLKSLEVKDYALIEHIQIEFERGLNIITGETGAGKSILIGAMSLLLGERASTDVIRKDAQKAIIEGVFDVESNIKVKSILEENQIEFQSELIVRREISLKGSNRCFVNDSPVQLSVIKDIGDLLVDLHGQHEHQSLLKTETHIEFLDDLFNNKQNLEKFNQQFSQLKSKIRELTELLNQEKSLKEKKEIYLFQIKEIDAVNPIDNEDEKILEELNILENSERLLELSNEAYDLLYDSENSVSDQLGEVQQKISKLAGIDKSFSETEKEINSVIEIIKEISSVVRHYKSNIEVDADNLEQKRERLAAINLLKKKYGGSLKTLKEHREKIGKEYNFAENFSDEIEKLKLEINSLRVDCGSAAEKISQIRNKSALKVENEVKKTLSSLGIPNASFKVNIENTVANSEEKYSVIVNNKKFICTESGIDIVEFYISTNVGENLMPLVKVASGGEISRIMLSLKSTLAKSDKLPLLIFDEIDTGVSGRIAQKVGSTLKELASFHQIIAITHLPQIAGQADYHFKVEKIDKDKRTISSIRKLNNDERVKEIAQLLSGEEISLATIESAKELLGISK